MSRSCSLLTILVFLLAIKTNILMTSSVSRSQDSAHIRHKDQQNGQQLSSKTLHDTLSSIDERLRLLEAYDNTYKLTKLDFTLEQLLNRAQTIESKLSRMEIVFDNRMTKVEDIVFGKEMKEGFTSETVARKIEDLNDKITNKAAQINAKMDQTSAKLDSFERYTQFNGDEILSKLIKFEEKHTVFESHVKSHILNIEQLVKHSLDANTNIKQIVSNNFGILKNLESFVSDSGHQQQLIESHLNSLISIIQQNSTHNTSQQSESERHHLRNLCQHQKQEINTNNNTVNDKFQNNQNVNNQTNSRTITDISNLENITSIAESSVEEKLTQLDAQVSYYSRKIMNAVQEIWRSSQTSENYLLDALDMANKTRSFIRQEFRRLQEQIAPLKEPNFDSIKQTLEEKVRHISTAVDDSFRAIMISQNSFISSCNRIQAEEEQLYDVLEDMLQEIRNKSYYDLSIINDKISTQNVMLNNSLTVLVKQIKSMMERVISEVKQIDNNNDQHSSAYSSRSTDKTQCFLTNDDLSNICYRIQKNVSNSKIIYENNNEESIKSEELRLNVNTNKTTIISNNNDYESDYDINGETHNSDYNTN